MQEQRRIVEELDLVQNIRNLAQAYEEISISRMNRIRGSVLKIRSFLSELGEVYYEVKNNYVVQIQELMKRKKQTGAVTFSLFKKNGKSVSVLVTANSKLYGDIFPKVFSLFIKSINKKTSDIVIIGKLGRDFMDQQNLGINYQYYEIPDEKITELDLKPIIATLLDYQKVTVYYGKFQNVLNQNPTASLISGEEAIQEDTAPRKKNLSIFEPELEKILQFFETQIFTSFFNQTVHESQLARYASRMRAMGETLDKITDKLQELELAQKRVHRKLTNRKQMETLAGINLWS